MDGLSFVWLEITGKCQLRCEHCYADSGPHGTDGAMTPNDWAGVIDQAAGLGTEMVQFIGGEPTLYRALPDLIATALDRGVQVEVYTNLVHVSSALWEVFEQPGVRLATSFYSDHVGEHESITQGRGSHARSTANIAEAVRRSIPLRVGLVDVRDGQRVEQARVELAALGVKDQVQIDRLRQVGRGVRTEQPSAAQLCGHCGRGQVAIAPDGSVWPCVFARWLPVGNVGEDTLADIVTGARMRATTASLAEQFTPHLGRKEPKKERTACDPQCCPSTMCDPKCSPSCSPSCRPQGNCLPSGNCAPKY